MVFTTHIMESNWFASIFYCSNPQGSVIQRRPLNSAVLQTVLLLV